MARMCGAGAAASIMGGWRGSEDSSFSEEKEAKRLFSF
jgi:hypothetical protein